MFERPRHRKIAKLLQAMDSDFLARAHCYFGGGTAITLKLGEYRESIDVAFLCSDKDGYRLLRNAITPPAPGICRTLVGRSANPPERSTTYRFLAHRTTMDLQIVSCCPRTAEFSTRPPKPDRLRGAVLRSPVKHVRDVRTHRDKISSFVAVDDVVIKIKFVLERRIDIGGEHDAVLGVPVLDRVDMYAEKLLANTDRGMDRSQSSRDLVDLAMMIDAWGPIPAAAVQKAEAAYGQAVYRSFDRGLVLLRDAPYRTECLKAMAMSPELGETIVNTLENNPPTPAPQS